MTNKKEGHKMHMLQLKRRNGFNPTKRMMLPGRMANSVYEARTYINSSRNHKQELTNRTFGNNKAYRDTVNPRK